MLSGYRLMWMLVMFDLPVMTKEERKAATDFRNALLDLGFEMSQFSVYLRLCTSSSQVDKYSKYVEQCLPKEARSMFSSSLTNSTKTSSLFTARRCNHS